MIRRHLKNERGFTLMEMLVVLMIFSVLTMIVSSTMLRFYEQQVYEQAIERFRLTLHEAHLTAIEQQQDVWVYVVEGKTIRLTEERVTRITDWEMPAGMTVSVSTDDRIRFKGNGHVSQLGQIKIESPVGTKRFSINLSNGRLREIE